MKFWDYGGADFIGKIGNIGQLAGIDHYEFADGREKGVEAFAFRTGSGLRFTVLPGRGMDISSLEYRGMPLSYMSKTGIVSPAYYESGGMGWVRSFFAGMLTTCGLMNVGGPVRRGDEVLGAREFGLHGRISNCAADQVGCFSDFEDGVYVMRATGRLREAVLHRESMSLRRTITTAFGEKSFTLRDVVTNESQYEQPYMLMYHINAGFPLLDSGSEFLSASRSVTALGGGAVFGDERLEPRFCEPPKLGAKELCLSHELAEDADGLVRVAVVNPRLEIGLGLSYRKSELPYFNQWKMFNEREYVLGLEPGNCLPVGLDEAERTGMTARLAPSESRTTELTFTVLDGADEIGAWTDMITPRGGDGR